jgi:DNA replication and repair protein RecF
LRILDLQLDRYRNIEHAHLKCHPKFNLIVGENGQGKTNLLSAMYWLATLTPLRTRRLRDLIKWGESDTSVLGRIELRGLHHRLGVGVQNGKRVAQRERKPCKSRDYFGALSVVSFTPYDLDLVRGAPELRRKMVDRAIFTEHPMHLDLVLRFQNTLDKRNHLLKMNQDPHILDAYESTLAEAGAWLMKSRADFISQITPRFEVILKEICQFDGTLIYKPGIQVSTPLTTSLQDLKGQLMEYWKKSRESDQNRGFTQRGPQIDDLSLRLEGRSAKSYASQGQQRGIVLALKIAQIEALSEKIHTRPVLLLDDVSSELDQHRSELLFTFLNQFDGQVFLTTTHEKHIPLKHDPYIWRVHGGHIIGDSQI